MRCVAERRVVVEKPKGKRLKLHMARNSNGRNQFYQAFHKLFLALAAGLAKRSSILSPGANRSPLVLQRVASALVRLEGNQTNSTGPSQSLSIKAISSKLMSTTCRQ